MAVIETWSPVVGHDGYEVSTLGRVRSLPRTRRGKAGSSVPVVGRILSQANRTGYRGVSLGKGRSALVHRLVASAFIPNPRGLPEVNHRDGDKSNNAVGNLEWVTHQANAAHASQTGLLATGARHGYYTTRRA